MKKKQRHHNQSKEAKSYQNQQQEANFVHIRRCHVCATLNERANTEVDRCTSCGKALAPFLFCESTYDSEAIELSKKVFTTNINGAKVIYPPLVGIALYW